VGSHDPAARQRGGPRRDPSSWSPAPGGHIGEASTTMIDNLDSKKRYRADVLLEKKAAGNAKRRRPARASPPRWAAASAVRLTPACASSSSTVSAPFGHSQLDQCASSASCSRPGGFGGGNRQIYLRPRNGQNSVNFLNVKSAHEGSPSALPEWEELSGTGVANGSFSDAGFDRWRCSSLSPRHHRNALV
jgi:glycyl-tRNA synthetase